MNDAVKELCIIDGSGRSVKVIAHNTMASDENLQARGRRVVEDTAVGRRSEELKPNVQQRMRGNAVRMRAGL